ncbi:nucleoside diphosphate kinase regulator [Vibrio salilacus]|uniref:nucleoside diphosphate kinase regulator n=1 Tax=Vibrio salilacus TaxID=1323749 RepID=UPI000C2B1F42|nr:nucleoside diphosphate kinase regulator [Vibrio salilacus]
MNTKPEIIISSLDLYRIYDLIELLSKPALHLSLNELEKELMRCDVVDPKEIPPTVVTMNSKVIVEVGAMQKKLEFTLVYPDDMENSGNTVSILAPVGTALLGLSIGDTIKYSKPGENALEEMSVVDIIYQPERAGDYMN